MKIKNTEDNYTLQGLLDFSKILQNLKKSISFAFKSDKARVIVLITIAVITAVIPYLQNGLFGKLIDSTINYKVEGTGLQGILFTVVLLIIATAIPNIASLIKSFVDTNFRFNLTQFIEIYFLKKISSLDIATIESTEYQELTQKANERGSMSIYQLISFSIDNFSNLIGVIVSLVILGFIDQTLLLYAFLGAIPALYVQLKYGKDIYWIWDLNSGNRRKYFNRRHHFQNTTALIEVKLYQLAKNFLGEIKNILSSFNDELKSTERNKLTWELLALGVFVVFLGMGMWRIVHLTISGTMPIGQMFFAYTTYRGFKGTLIEFFRKIGWMSEFSNYVGYWFKIDDLVPKIQNEKDAYNLHIKDLPPRIEFKNVSFRYDVASNKSYAIKDLSFVVEPGQKIAIVGLSGAGKTTLIKLLCRIYDPESGHILINGKDLREINLDSWQEQLAVMFQDFATYEFTVRESIAFGNPNIEPNEKKIKQAAEMAKAHDFIDRLPKKYDQLLWKGFEDGVDLSKGERQRMALARVLYRESPITILDEPTASVDALAEQEIFGTLEKLPGDRTVILISHRFSTVKNTDNILVIEHGQLIEEGSHLKLMKEKGKYAELYKLQKESYD
ncbi:MAG: ABC transporter ATP-binding protein [Candidatus Paceibacterota bacterium]|jgi:ABC-type multidrug transport system fused ATPase/permease subunit